IAQAQSEPATTSNNQTGTATASAEYSQALDATNVVAAPYEAATATDAAAHAAASFHDESASPNPVCEAVKTAAEENDIPIGFLGLAAAAYNAGGGRIEKWLSRRSTLPKETRAYVKIITGHGAEAWTDEENTVYMPTDLPQKAPCEGIGGLSRQDQVAAVNVDLTPSASALLRKAEADEAEDRKNAAAKKLRVAASSMAARGRAASRKTNARAVLL